MIKLKRGDVVGGNEDIAAAKAVRDDIAAVFASYGLSVDPAASIQPASAVQPALAIPPAPAARAPTASTSAGDCAQAETHWKSVEEMKTLEAYQDHLARFPNCAFAGLAAVRVKGLAK